MTFYYAVDEFGDKMRRFYSIRLAKQYISNKPGWSLLKEKLIIKPVIDWTNFEEALF